MPSKRDILGQLTRDELLAIVDRFELPVRDRKALDPLRGAIASSKSVTLASILGQLSRAQLHRVCRALGISGGISRKPELVARLTNGSSGAAHDRHGGPLDAARAREAANRKFTFDALAEILPQIVWMADSGGRNTYFSKKWVTYTGLSLADSRGDGWGAAFHPDDLRLVLAAWRQAVKTNGPYSVEARVRHVDGRYRWWLIRGAPLYDESGEFVSWYGTLTDVEDLKQTEVALERARDEAEATNQKLHLANDEIRRQSDEAVRRAHADLVRATRLTTMGEIAASVVHQIIQPLSGVVTNGQACLRWLSHTPPNVEQARLAVEDLVGDGLRASDIVKSMRALATKNAPDFAELAINDAIREVFALLRSELHRRGVTLETDLPGDLRPVLADRIQMQQVLLNLMMNGADAMKANVDDARILRVSTRHGEGDTVVVAVEDSGPGFAPEAAGRLFEAFFTTKPGGMGMGLSICRSIVEAHGGRLTAASRSPRGAVFEFSVPTAIGRAPDCRNDGARV